jgi:hypothetical protein
VAGPVVVSIIGDTKDLVNKLGQGESRLGRFGRAAGTVGKVAAAGAAAGALALGGLAVSAVKSASDAQQSLGATETVFGRFSKTVIDNSNKAAKSVGLSGNQYRESANLIGSLFKNQGVAADQLAGKTDQMVKTGADLAATFGGTTKDAVEALGSAFKGEFDPLEKYGISIKQSTINAELAARGQDKLTGSALKAAQQQATSRLIMKQGADSLGAFGKESNTLAHQQQVLGAQWENLKAKGGSLLLPVLTKLGAAVNDKLFPALEKMGPPIGRFATAAGGVLGPILQRVGQVIAASWPVVQRLAGAFASVLPPILRVAGEVGHNLKPIFDQLATTFRTQVLPAIVRVTPQVQAIATKVGTFAGAALRLFSAIAGKVLPVVIRVAGFLIARLIPTVVRVVTVVFRVISVLVSLGVGLARAGAKAVQFAATVVRFIAGIPGRVSNAITALVGKGRDLITGFIRGIGQKISDAVGKVKDLISRAKGAIPGADALYNAGKNLIQGLVNGIGDKIGDAVQKVKDGLNKIKGLLPGSPIKEGPLKSWNNGGAGKRLMALLAEGLGDTRAIDRAMETVSRHIDAGLLVTSKGSPDLTLKARAAAEVATARGGAAGAPTVQITIERIEVPIGATGADIGRELVEYLHDAFAAGVKL